ncbi:UNVERIFIED_CONTAM: Mannosyltransferase OCH1 and related enzymes [Acetivibrio alkalicellulosi]
MSIPKKIHYCWFGHGQFTDLALNCINSWKKHLSEYELILWNEDNFDININQYVKEAYEAKKYAFVTDYVRLYVLYYYGGIYMDTDVEVLKPFDRFLNNYFFIGCEKDDLIQTGLIGSIPKHNVVKKILSYYDNKRFILEDGSLNLLPNPKVFTPILSEDYGWFPKNTYQSLSDGIKVYPIDYFCAKDWKTGEIFKSENTYAIHHYSGSWHTKTDKIKNKIKNIIGSKGTQFVVSVKKKIKGS